jgi:hypothetical protein
MSMIYRVLAAALSSAIMLNAPEIAFAKGKLLLKVTDAKTGELIPFRIHLRNEKQVPVKVPPLPFWHDHLSAPGSLELSLFKGNYFFEIEHGPEFVTGSGYFTIHDGADDEKVVALKRACDMAAEGWRSGDFDVRRPVRELELAMLADDLRFAPLVTWSNRRSEWAKTKFPAEPLTRFDHDGRLYDVGGGADDRPGGPIHLFRLSEPAPLPADATQLASLIPKLRELKEQQPDAWLDVAHPCAWDLPLLVAAGLVDSYCLAPSQLLRDKVDPAAVGRPFSRGQYPGLAGLGDFACDAYFHLLNVGLRIAPSAGSGSGTVGNPVGYNRVYVWNDPEKFEAADWWESLKQGRAIVTNGPLIRPKANGRLPGNTFDGKTGEPVTLQIALDLTTRDKIDYVEVIQNGSVVYNVPLRDWAKDGGRFPPLTFRESGWCLVRVRCDSPKTFRFALSAPWYVAIDDKPRTGRTSAQFFLDWVEERAASLKIADAAERTVAEEQIAAARKFWRKKVDDATSP